MAGPIPFETFRSRTAAALHFRQTMSEAEIAARMQLPLRVVTGLLASAAQQGHRKREVYCRTTLPSSAPRPRPETGHTVQIILPQQLYAALIDEARRQKMTPAQLARAAVAAFIEQEDRP